MAEWREIIQAFYPNILQEKYCVPPVCFNRVPYSRQVVSGQPVLVKKPPTGGQTSAQVSASTSQPALAASSKGAVCALKEKDNGQTQLDSQNQGDNRVQGDGHSQGHDLTLGDSQTQGHDLTQGDSQTQGLDLTQRDSQTQGNNQTQGQARELPPRGMWTQDTNTDAALAEIFDNDVRDDFAQQHVLFCLNKLCDKLSGPMVIVSQLSFRDYLNKPSYAAAVKTLPRPSDFTDDSVRRGDFDVCLFSKQHGILVGEIKSVGLNSARLNKSQAEIVRDVAKKALRGVKQLNKSERVMRHMTSDFAPGVRIKKTLILPYVSMEQLDRVLNSDTKLEQALCQSLGVSERAAAIQLCVCTDWLSDRMTPDIVLDATLSTLQGWFEQLMEADCSTDPQFSTDAYLELVARVVGPATTVSIHCVSLPRVEVRTVSEALSEVGERLTRLVLTPAQLDLLNRAPRLACLTGPPGTGKSITLALMGLEWLRKGHDVHVLSSYRNSLAASRLLHHQLQRTLQEDSALRLCGGRVHLHEFDFGTHDEDEGRALDVLLNAASDGSLHILMDEIKLGHNDLGPCIHRLVSCLSARVPHFCLWAALLTHDNIPPDLPEERLTVPLRCAPIIIREVERGVTWAGNVHSYTTDGIPAPSDGLNVVRLRHDGAEHDSRWPVDCVKCGQDVAQVLKQLRVGESADEMSSATTSTPPPLCYRDVFVLTRSHTLTDNVFDASGKLISPVSGFVRGLQDKGVPVCALGRRRNDVKKWETDVAEMAVSQKDQVTVSDYRVVSGLERKIVVYLPGQVKGDDSQTADFVEGNDRLFALSRCTSQLVMVEMPPN